MKRILAAVVLLMAVTVAAVPAFAAPDKPRRLEARIYAMVEYYDWKEIDDDGSQLLTETGAMGGIGGEVSLRLVNVLWLEFKPEVYGGELDYDGALQDGTPFTSSTTIVGGKGNLTMAARIPVTDNAHIKPMAGVGTRLWTRSLDKRLGDVGVGEHGYDEHWKTVYGIAGVGGDARLSARIELFGSLGVYIPIWNENDVDLSASGGPSSIKVAPGKVPYVAGEVGVNAALLSASFFVETLKFSKSDEVQIGGGTFWQPESEATMLGVKLGVHF